MTLRPLSTVRGPTVKSRFILGTQILRLVARVLYSTVLYFMRPVCHPLTLFHCGRLTAVSFLIGIHSQLVSFLTHFLLTGNFGPPMIKGRNLKGDMIPQLNL